MSKNISAPHYPKWPRQALSFQEDPEDNTCYQDPVTGEFICDVTEPYPKGPGPIGEYPDTGDSSDWPPYPQDPSPFPSQEKQRVLEAVIGRILGELIQSTMAGWLGSRPVYTNTPVEPLRLSETFPASDMPRVRARPPEPIQPRPLPPSAPSMSQTRQESSHYQLMNRLRETQRQQMDRLAERNRLRDTSQVMRGLAEAYGPGAMSPPSPVEQSQPGPYDTYQPTVDSESQAAFRNLFEPSGGSSAPFILEDQRWIQESLSHAGRPLSWQDQTQLQQAQQQAYAQQQIQQAQLDAARAQRDMYEAQTRLLQKQQSELVKRSRPAAEIKSRPGEKTALWPKLDAGEMLNDAEIKQLFHTLDVEKYGAETDSERIQAEILRQHAEDLLVQNRVANAEQDAEGNVLLHGVPVRPEDAAYFARQDIQHFLNTDRHLKPDQLRALEQPEDIYLEPGTPDVTGEAALMFAPVGKLLRPFGVAGKAILEAYAAREAAKRVIFFTEEQIAKVYMRHGRKLGMMGNYNPANAQLLRAALTRHVKNPTTELIKGTYRNTIEVYHYYNPHTNTLVMTYRNSEILSAWRLSKEQITSLYRTGNIQ